MNPEDQFFLEKLELDCGNKKAINKIKKIAQQVKWLQGWPEDKSAFWNGEAFMWEKKINQHKRELIEKELRVLKGKNLDLGCGSYSYLPSVGLDISEKMLLFNDKCKERILGDLEKDLPFKEKEFDSITLVFVLNYVKNLKIIFKEIKRVLKDQGKLIVVQYRGEVNAWQRNKEINLLSLNEWLKLIEKHGFKVIFKEKEGLGFFKCTKII